MKHPIESMIVCAALLTGSITAHAEDAAPATAPASEEKGINIKIDLDSNENDGDGKGALIAIDTEADADDDGPVGRAIRKGVAELLEEHLLDRESLSEEDRAEVREAIAELRGEIDSEMQDVQEEIEKEVGAVKKKKRAGVINKTAGDTEDDDDFGNAMGAVIAITAIIFTFGMPIIIVAVVLYFAYRRRRLAHDTINQYLASGKEIPPEIMQNLFKDAAATATPRTSLQKGTINTSIGLGMVIGFNAIDAEFLAAIGFIFLLVGLAQLLIWKLEQGKKSEGGSTQG